MPIVPLPIMLEEEDRKVYDKLEPPKSMVVRYGYMRMVAELPYDGQAKPGCGSKLVIRTSRGIELAVMLTSTCPNSGCGHSVSRKDMLEYIDRSGGKNYPFTTQGRILRVATVEDLNEQSRLDASNRSVMQFANSLIRELDLPMKLVDVEQLLGGERVIFHYTSEQWVDFRELVRQLASQYQTRIEMHQVNARDEARLVADYEKCGQHCCCKQFLKVLKPVSMRSAKVQKATLDPTKISGRCGRLMCCLRYEDETYESLRKRLPHKQTRVVCDDGIGTVIDTQILTQLVLVRLDKDNSHNAYPLENLEILSKDRERELMAEAQEAAEEAARQREASMRRSMREPRRPRPGPPQRSEEAESKEGPPAAEGGEPSPGTGRKRRRRRRRKGGEGGGDTPGQGGDGSQARSHDEGSDAPRGSAPDDGGGGAEAGPGPDGGGGDGDDRPRKRRRRRRRRRGPGGEGGGAEGPPQA